MLATLDDLLVLSIHCDEWSSVSPGCIKAFNICYWDTVINNLQGYNTTALKMMAC